MKWASAAVAGLALVFSAIINGLGFSNAASHIASNALSLFGYFQAQAMLGLCAVPLPPVVKSWTQDFQWSMGIIKTDFMQDILTWYQRSTGGTPSTILDTLHTVSVQVEKVKRSLPVVDSAVSLVQRSAGGIAKRATETSYGSYVVSGIQRVAFRAGIETTNLFLTGLVFFYIFMIFAALGVVIFKAICEGLVKAKLMQSDTFAEFRAGWLTVLKGKHHRWSFKSRAPHPLADKVTQVCSTDGFLSVSHRSPSFAYGNLRRTTLARRWCSPSFSSSVLSSP